MNEYSLQLLKLIYYELNLFPIFLLQDFNNKSLRKLQLNTNLNLIHVLIILTASNLLDLLVSIFF